MTQNPNQNAVQLPPSEEMPGVSLNKAPTQPGNLEDKLPDDYPFKPGEPTSADILAQGTQQPGQKDEIEQLLTSLFAQPADQQTPAQSGIQAPVDAEMPPNVGQQLPGQQQPAQQTPQQKIQLTPEQQAQLLAEQGLPYTSFDEMKQDVELGNQIKNDPNALRAITNQYAQNMGIPNQPQSAPYYGMPQQTLPPNQYAPTQAQPAYQQPPVQQPQQPPQPNQQSIIDQMNPAQRAYFEQAYNEMVGRQGLVSQQQVQQMIAESQAQTEQKFRQENAGSYYDSFFERQKPQIEALGLNVQQVKLKVHQAAAKHGMDMIYPNSLPGLFKEAMLDIPGGFRAFADNQQQTALGNVQQKQQVTVPIQSNTQTVNQQPRDLKYYMQPHIRAQLNQDQLLKVIQAYNNQYGQ